jgi:hypothetical protein
MSPIPRYLKCHNWQLVPSQPKCKTPERDHILNPCHSHLDMSWVLRPFSERIKLEEKSTPSLGAGDHFSDFPILVRVTQVHMEPYDPTE